MNLINCYVLACAAVVVLKSEVIVGQKLFEAFAPFVEQLIKQVSDLNIESEDDQSWCVKVKLIGGSCREDLFEGV